MRMSRVMLRYACRVFLLAAVVVFALGPFSPFFRGVLMDISPFMAVMSAIGLRAVTPFFFICLPIIIISLVRRRWFCNYACPTGLILEIVSRLRRKDTQAVSQGSFRIGKLIVLSAFGGAIVGYPLFLWCDPLALLNGFFSVFHSHITGATIASALGLVSLLVLSIWRPNLWCRSICPLGTSQEILYSFSGICAQRKVAADRSALEPGKGRRFFLGWAAGCIAGGLLRKVSGKALVIRPPGAIPEQAFTALCARCGTCAAACPEGIIHPDLGSSGVAGLLTPAITIHNSYCIELCHECGKVCPTNAIRHESLEVKQNISIGIAELIKPLCLSWEKREFCMVCAGYCPYNAVKGIDMDGIECPEIIEDRCRGCGACQVVCPAEKLAIIVRPIPQKMLDSVKVKAVGGMI